MGITAVKNFITFNTGQSNETASAACDSIATAYYVTTEGAALGISVPVLVTISA
jgi:hypothetical protein